MPKSVISRWCSVRSLLLKVPTPFTDSPSDGVWPGLFGSSKNSFDAPASRLTLVSASTVQAMWAMPWVWLLRSWIGLSVLVGFSIPTRSCRKSPVTK